MSSNKSTKASRIDKRTTEGRTPELITKQQVCFRVGVQSYHAINKLIKDDTSFPRPVSAKSHHNGTELFDEAAVLAWAKRHQKGFCSIDARQAISGKLWPIYIKPVEYTA